MDGEPPTKLEQLNNYLGKNDKTKFLVKTLGNIAEYQRGEAMLEYYKIHKNNEEAWAKTSAGSWANASLTLNYFQLCNQFYGFIFCTIR